MQQYHLSLWTLIQTHCDLFVCLFVCLLFPWIWHTRSDIDAWELRRGLNELYGHDLVPEPKIVNAMLHACRRLNDFAMGVRVLEAVKDKAAGNNDIYNYILQQCKPTIEELGISTPEELGLA